MGGIRIRAQRLQRKERYSQGLQQILPTTTKTAATMNITAIATKTTPSATGAATIRYAILKKIGGLLSQAVSFVDLVMIPILILRLPLLLL